MQETKNIVIHERSERRTRVRWAIVSLLFIAILFNYADREIWIVSEPAFAYSFGWSYSPTHLDALAIHNISLILFFWSLSYAIFNFPGGWIVDKLGLRKSMTTMFAIWSIFTALTAATFNFITMAIVRIVMGAGEGPVWPINSKVVKGWASRFDESKSFTLAGAGQAVGPVIGLIAGGILVTLFGWPSAFIFFGVLGLIFVAIWFFYVRDRPSEDSKVNENELAYIIEGKTNEEKEEKILPSKVNWKISARMIFGTQAGLGTLLVFLSFGYVLFTFLYWLPPLMFSTFAHTVEKSGLYSAAIDVALIAGFLGSGPFNDGLLKRFPDNKPLARRLGAIIPMVLMIVMVGLSYFTGKAHNLVGTAIFLGVGSGLMNLTVGSWAVNAVDLAPAGTSATVYGIYNGSLNFIGAFNAIIEGILFIRYGPVLAFTSSILFMLMFLGGYLGLIRKNTWERAMKYKEELSREAYSYLKG
ncbi:metabolite transporter [Thermoplasma volcanium GSS1]|uniref:Metabolite transporter n=1 Tax=Thermoplasma volcanium (strain ATCC 51530 / DSM 4299 / JCM 9571 / NBRC 15438 / GSS1) TaxID=273116 RepID=Q97CC5_THEVO|nr:MFS transporter [Thermoplasma volcanium]BAB59319.1 metabolite transporter [Thermoplasma volcanium GSS1]